MIVSTGKIKIILMADGDTDYTFMMKVLKDDNDISNLNIKLIRPEELGLRRRSGGGHNTLCREAGLAAIKAANGYADGVMVLVDNDGDERFLFPHNQRCNDCRECDALDAIERINWGKPIKKTAVILYQAIATLLLSTGTTFTPQIEEQLFGNKLKKALYKKEIKNLQEKDKAFIKELEKINVKKIRARSYPRIKRALFDLNS
jgi:hypothetical protein